MYVEGRGALLCQFLIKRQIVKRTYTADDIDPVLRKFTMLVLPRPEGLSVKVFYRVEGYDDAECVTRREKDPVTWPMAQIVSTR